MSASVLVLGTVKYAGQTAPSEKETGVSTPKAALAFAVTPQKVAAGVVRAVRKDRGLIVLTPGPGRLMKAMMDLFGGMGPLMNRMTGVTPVMLRIAQVKETQAALARTRAADAAAASGKVA